MNHLIPWKKNNKAARICGTVVGVFLAVLFVLCAVSAPRGKTDATEMTFHEFGVQNVKTVVLIHPSIVMWDYFEYVIPLLEDDFHVIVPALSGYDTETPQADFSSIEQIASGIERYIMLSDSFGTHPGFRAIVRMFRDVKKSAWRLEENHRVL